MSTTPEHCERAGTVQWSVSLRDKAELTGLGELRAQEVLTRRNVSGGAATALPC